MLFAVCVLLLLAIVAYVLYEMFGQAAMVDNVSRRAVFITGCDTGFGTALARRLDGLGARVFAGCLTEEGATKLRQQASSRLQAIVMDVTKTPSIEAAYRVVKESLEPGEILWAVVNNAGIGAAGGPLDFLTRRTFSMVFDVNVFGMAEVSRVFLPLLKKSQGRLINMTSIAGLIASSMDIAYSASKFAAEGLSDTLRRTLYIWGIKVCVIEPSFFKTPIIAEEQFFNKKKAQWDGLPAEVKEEYGEAYVEEAWANQKGIMASASLATDEVIDAYQHAILAKNPRLRYRVGGPAQYLYVMTYLPTRVMDYLMRSSHPPALPKALKEKRSDE